MNRNEKLSEGLSSLLGVRNEMKERFNSEDPVTAQQDEAVNEEQDEQESDIINTIEDEALKEALREHRRRKVGRPRKDSKDRSADGEKYVRFTSIGNREQLAKLKEIGFRETLTLKEIMEQIFADAIEAYERKNGVIVPKIHKGDPSKLFK